MTIEELQQEVIKLNNDITELQKEKDNLTTTISTKDTEIETYTKQVSQLREHNNYLFTRVTQESQPPVENPKPKGITTADIIDKFLK